MPVVALLSSKKTPEIIDTIHSLLECDEKTGGCPMGEHKWTHQTASKISTILRKQLGIKISASLVHQLLGDLGYSLKSNKKCLSSGNASGRDIQFGMIANLREKFIANGDPIISVDTKKKELIGLFRNSGQTWCREAIKVRDHDFRSEAKGIAVPYGILDIVRNYGFLVVGESADTPEFAVSCIVNWWQDYGRDSYPDSKKLLILADSGGSNGARPRTWKKFLQKRLADDLGLTITVAHYPSGASKWNPIEHRMFSEISKNWRGKPLIDFDAVVNFAKDTTTKAGLHIDACRDKSEYEKGKKVSDKEMALLAITKNEILGKWNYTISQRPENFDRNFSPEIFIPNIPEAYTREKNLRPLFKR